jgi:hypothetical protein
MGRQGKALPVTECFQAQTLGAQSLGLDWQTQRLTVPHLSTKVLLYKFGSQSCMGLGTQAGDLLLWALTTSSLGTWLLLLFLASISSGWWQQLVGRSCWQCLLVL